MEIKNIDKPGKKGVRKYFTRRNILVMVMVVSLFAGYKSSRILQTKGYDGLWDFFSTYVSNYSKGMGASAESISIEIKDKDFKILQKHREKALERGVIINDLDGEYVSATIEYKGEKIKVKLRLKGHMTDHLQEDKWSFRIKVKDNDTFMGMKRFSIQHPGTRGYIYEWIYHELMKREDVIALHYSFINVSVNGKDWGVYALEENFESELARNNGRVKSPIIRFNPDLYWVQRYNMMKDVASADEFASYYSANAEAYRENDVLGDTIQKALYLKALALVESLRSKKITVDQAFDIQRLAKFSAIIDLVGGEHSIDWSDIKYYYNPATMKFEPVAYESFTNLSARHISGLYRFKVVDSVSNYADWHTMIFSNETFFREYVKQLERISSPNYLDDFFKSCDKELSDNLKILFSEFPYKKFEKEAYYKRQKQIAAVLDPPKSVHAYLKERKGNTLLLQVAPIDALPVEVYAVTVNGISSVAQKSVILPAKQINEFLRYSTIEFKMPEGLEWKPGFEDSVKIRYTVLGSSRKKDVNVFSFPYTDHEYLVKDIVKQQPNADKCTFLTLRDSIYSFNSKDVKITEDLVIPPNYCLVATAGTTIDICNKARVLSHSPVEFVGEEHAPVIITSSDSSSQGIFLLTATKKSFLRNVVFKTMPAVISGDWKKTAGLMCYESPIELKACRFSKCMAGAAIRLIRSNFTIANCLFDGMNADALRTDFSSGNVTSCSFENCKGKAVDLGTGKIKLNGIHINDAAVAIDLNEGVELSGADLRIYKAGIAFDIERLVMANLDKVQIHDSERGVVTGKTGKINNPSVITFKSLVMKNVINEVSNEKGVILNINGASVTKEASENVKSVSKNEE